MTEPSIRGAQTAFNFDNTFARDLKGLYASVQPEPATKPKLIFFNRELAHELGLDVEALDRPGGAEIFSGNVIPQGAEPLAQAYAGHQFGGFSPQLGDGRALLLGEVMHANSGRRDIQLKGSGRTPFSRSGDGRAALGPVLREVLISEAMHALGIPSSRALAAVTTGDPVYRETTLPGAVLTRIAASHIRIGTFQFFAARGELERVRQLADYTIRRHFPDLEDDKSPYLGLLRTVSDLQAELVARWMLVGFIHGVMNTDNMALSGETIDYGPCAFMDSYDPATVFSSIDSTGRYSYANQPIIARWNLVRFAETLLPLLHENEDSAVELASEVIDQFPETYQGIWLRGMRAKLGLTTGMSEDLALANDLLSAMKGNSVDFTQLFRQLADAAESTESASPTQLAKLFDNPEPFAAWFPRWCHRCAQEPSSEAVRARAMRRANPIYIPRNHHVEAALRQAVRNDDYRAFRRLHKVLAHPYAACADCEKYAEPAPRDSESYVTFCGT